MYEAQGTPFRSLGQEDPLEKEMATHSSILAWEVPWTEESGGLQSMGLESQRRLSTLPLVIFLSSWHIVIVQRALSHSLNYSEILPICFFSSLFLQCSDIWRTTEIEIRNNTGIMNSPKNIEQDSANCILHQFRDYYFLFCFFFFLAFRSQMWMLINSVLMSTALGLLLLVR